jgi:hypothetical protein
MRRTKPGAAHTLTLCLLIAPTLATGAPPAPAQPVSPAGSAAAPIAATCPTFSWGAVAGAERYVLALYDAQWHDSLDQAEQAAMGAPLQQITIDAPATSWTPAGAQCLDDGADYVWFVQAETAEGPGPWSPGAAFSIDFGADALSAVVRRELAAQLRRPEVWREVIQEALATPAISPRYLAPRVDADIQPVAAAALDVDETAAGTFWQEGTLQPQAAATSFPNPAAFKTQGPRGVVFGSGNSGEGGIPAEGAGARFMWYPGKRALRAGAVNGGQWDDAQVGDYSIAMGYSNTASGYGSTALGWGTTASGTWSTALGFSTTAQSAFETVIGSVNTVVGGNPSSWAESDRLFVIGNGTSIYKRSDALVVLKNGDVGLGNSAPVNRLHAAEDTKLYNGFQVENYVALIENTATDPSADVLALKIGTTGNPGTAANFVAFFDGDSSPNSGLIGQIEGNGSGGVQYTTAGADYAEYLPMRDPRESLEAGDVVGVSNGHIGLNTSNADQVMAITDRAAVAGNMPTNGESAEGYRPVTFIGQVPVKVSGMVSSGDVILASGHHDGTAIAVSLDQLEQAAETQIIGRAWQGSDDPGLKKVMVAVGLDQTDIATRSIERSLARVSAQQQAIIEGLVQSQSEQREQLARLERENANLRRIHAEMETYRSSIAEEMAFLRAELKRLGTQKVGRTILVRGESAR